MNEAVINLGADADLESDTAPEPPMGTYRSEGGPAARDGNGIRRASGEIKRLQTRLRGLAGKAIDRYGMIEAGDRVMVCMSGGKDSYVMLEILLALQRSAPVEFDLIAVNLDQKQPGFPEHVLPDFLRQRGVPFEIIEQDTYSVVKRVLPEGKTTCGLCSRLRRGALYSWAAANGITKIALGHRKLKAMPPKLLSDDGRNVVIRPLFYCAERDIERFARARRYPVIPCNLCGSQAHLQRAAIKRMLREWEGESPGRAEAVFRSLQCISPSQLADPDLFDFKSLAARD
jgi:tRNA 2-thiocytidine biosynthesis protein TtcA